jgi:hypothetical protein
MSSQELAKAGFFYFNDLDRVQCIFCLGIVQAWQPRDDAMGEHRRLFPTCAFVMGLPCGNIPVVHPRDDLSAVRRYTPSTLLALPISENIKESKLTANGTIRTNLQVYSISNTHRSQFAYYHHRRSTFAYWPHGIGLSTMRMAAAGFFYTSVSDQVACYSCNLHLRGWDVEHNPFDEHNSWSPRCEFLANLTNLKVDEELERRRFLDAEREARDEASTSSAALLRDEQRSPLTMGATGTTSDSRDQRDEDFCRKKVLKSLEAMKDSDDEEKEDVDCKICFSKQRAVVFLPCGHFVCCSKCGLKVTKCPMCRMAIMSIIHVFM